VQYEIEWDGIVVTITHIPNWLNTGHDHVELRAAEQLPVTETGYRSHYMQAAELALFKGVEGFVRQWLDGAAQSKEWQKHLVDRQQLSLF